jgi:hypothetical protein
MGRVDFFLKLCEIWGRGLYLKLITSYQITKYFSHAIITSSVISRGYKKLQIMRLLLFAMFFLISCAIYSQHFGMIYTAIPQNKTERFFDKQIKKGQENSSIVYSSKKMLGDTLIYYVRMEVQCFSLKFTFNYDSPIYETKCCDYQEVAFECQTCAKRILNEIKKKNKFRQKSENLYLSSYFVKTEMEVQYDSSGIDIHKLIFRPVDLTRSEYKEYYKTLRKN